MNLLKTSLLAAALFAAAPMAIAAGSSTSPKTATIPVTLTLENSCAISAAGVNFGTVSTLASNIDSTGSVTVTCTAAGTYTVAFNAGTTAGGTLAQRLLANGGSTIQYNLFSDAAHSTKLGDGVTSSTATVGGTGDGTAQPYTIYGRVPGGQGFKPLGTYTDTVTATITF